MTYVVNLNDNDNTPDKERKFTFSHPIPPGLLQKPHDQNAAVNFLRFLVMSHDKEVFASKPSRTCVNCGSRATRCIVAYLTTSPA